MVKTEAVEFEVPVGIAERLREQRDAGQARVVVEARE